MTRVARSWRRALGGGVRRPTRVRRGLVVLFLACILLEIGAEDYRQVPLAGGDVSFYINAVCESGGRVFVGGELNKIGGADAFNFGYFDESSRWVSPPVTIGPDPSTLMYSSLTFGLPLDSPSWDGKVLSLACPSKGNVVIIAGDFIFGGRRVVPGWAASTQNVVLNHLAIFRLDDTGDDVDASNLCPVGRLDLSSSSSSPSDEEGEEKGAQHRRVRGEPPPASDVRTGKKLQKVSCTPDGRPPPEGEVGVVMIPPSNNDVNGPPIATPRPFISTVLCLTDDCTDMVVGGRFNSVLGVEAHSVALLRFDDGFYSAVAQSLQQVPGSSSGVLAWPLHQAPLAEEGGVLGTAAASCVAPIPGVDGSVFSLALVGKWVILGGSFTRAGAVNVNNVAAWEWDGASASGSGRLVCLGHEKGASPCSKPDFCCQGFPGSVRSVLAVSSTQVLLSGYFADTSSPSGTNSFSIALIELPAGSAGLQGWSRRAIVDPGTNRATGPNGVITTARCMGNSSGSCEDVLVGGWFDGLLSYDISGPYVISYNATPWGLLSTPLALVHVPTDPLASATITPVNITITQPQPLPPSHASAATTPGINAILPLSDGERVLLAGHLPKVGNLAELMLSSGDLAPFLPPTVSSIRGDASSSSSSSWSSDDEPPPDECWDLQTKAPYPVLNRTVSFCCSLGSMCPYEGLAVPCPADGGYHCLGNQSEPGCCTEGSYCPTPGTSFVCARGYYCPAGSTDPIKCQWWQWCHKEGLNRPDKLMAGAYALGFVVALFLFLRAANEVFLRLRAYYRQARDNQRRAAAGGAVPHLTRATSSHRMGGSVAGRKAGEEAQDGGGWRPHAPPSHSKRVQLQEPLLGEGDIEATRRTPSPPFPEPGDDTQEDDGVPKPSAVADRFYAPPPAPTRRVEDDGEQQPQEASSALLTSSSQQQPSSSIRPRTQRRGAKQDGPAPSSSSYYYRERRRVDRIDLHFENLNVELPGQKRVLHEATGGFRAGRVTAVMGPSGCGKTTLISALSNRLGLGSKIAGRTFINGAPESCAAMHDLIGFVPQDDIMHHDLTVKENLLYCCQLRADPKMSRPEQLALVERVIESLGLSGSRHSIIGSTEERGISGGQRKRVNVAMELISQPLVLFLDEPTSGLDSTTAEELMQYLKKLALGTGLTVGAVIHQPRIEVFLGIDDVLFLARGGRVAYYGPAKDAVSYFEGLGYSFAPQVNPADRILDLITKTGDVMADAWRVYATATAATHTHTTTLAKRFGFWSPPVTPPVEAEVGERYGPSSSVGMMAGGGTGRGVVPRLSSTEGARVVMNLDGSQRGSRTLSVGADSKGSSSISNNSKRGGEGVTPRRAMSVDGGGGGGRRTPFLIIEEELPSRNYPSLAAQAWTCFWRSLRQQHNSLHVARQDLLFLLTFGLLCGLFDLNMTEYELAVLCMGLTSTVFGVRFFSTERVVFWRECASGISIPAYFLGKLASAVPLMSLYPLAFLAFNYSMAFPKVDFLFYYLALLWAGWVCFGVGVIMSLVLEPKNAQVGGVVAALVGFLFGGHNPPVTKLNATAVGRIGMDLSYVRWAIGALFIREATYEPPCSAWFIASGLARTGYLPPEAVQVPPQLFQVSSLDNDVSRCLQVLQVICVAYLSAAMVLMWLSGKWRARMIQWDFVRVGCNQRRLKFRRAFLDCLYRHRGWIPLWFIDAMAGYSPVPDEDEEEDEEEEGLLEEEEDEEEDAGLVSHGQQPAVEGWGEEGKKGAAAPTLPETAV